MWKYGWEQSLVVVGIVEEEILRFKFSIFKRGDITFLICQMITCGHVIRDHARD